MSKYTNLTCEIAVSSGRNVKTKKTFRAAELMFIEEFGKRGFFGHYRLNPDGAYPGHGAGVIIGTVMNRKTIRIRIQPGHNGTAWKYLVYLPEGVTPESVVTAFQKVEEKPAEPNDKKADEVKGDSNVMQLSTDQKLVAIVCDAVFKLSKSPSQADIIEVIQTEFMCSPAEALQGFRILTSKKVFVPYKNGSTSQYYVDNIEILKLVKELNPELHGQGQPTPSTPSEGSEQPAKDRLREIAAKASLSTPIQTLPPVVDEAGKAELPNGRRAPVREVPPAKPAPSFEKPKNNSEQEAHHDPNYNGERVLQFTKLQDQAFAYDNAHKLVQEGGSGLEELRTKAQAAQAAVDAAQAVLKNAEQALSEANSLLKNEESRNGEKLKTAYAILADSVYRDASNQYKMIIAMLPK